MTLDLAIIGCGRFAHHYHVPALRQRDDVRLVGVCDPFPSPETCDLAQEVGAMMTDEIQDLIAKARPQAVLISSPHGLHAAHIEQCLRAGLHVLVDKPFVVSLEDAGKLTALAASVGVIGAVAFNRRLDAGFCYARQVLLRGGVGDIMHVESLQLGYPAGGWYDDPLLGGGGPFAGRGAHMADIVPWLTGLKVRALSATLAPASSRQGIAPGGFIAADLGGLSWHATILAGDHWNLDEVRLYGSRGYLVVRRPADQTFSWVTEQRDLADSLVGKSELGQAGTALDDFVAAIAGSQSPACPFAEAVASVAIIETAFAATRSAGAPLPVSPEKTVDGLATTAAAPEIDTDDRRR